MPNDDPYYRAKILYIVGSQMLLALKDIIECSDTDISLGIVFETFNKKIKDYYHYVNGNYLSMLLNHDNEGSVVDIKIRLAN